MALISRSLLSIIAIIWIAWVLSSAYRRPRIQRRAVDTTWAEAALCHAVDHSWGRTALRHQALSVDQAQHRHSPRLLRHQVYECPHSSLYFPFSIYHVYCCINMQIDTRFSKPTPTCQMSGPVKQYSRNLFCYQSFVLNCQLMLHLYKNYHTCCFNHIY